MTLPPKNHNGGPDLLDDAIGIDPEALELSEGILTGQPVENDAQMHAVDDITKRLKAIKKAVTVAKDSETKPLHDAWKKALSRYRPTEDDLDRQIKGCVGMVDAYKRQKVAEQAERERQSNIAAAAARKAAEDAARTASVSDLDAQRAADEALQHASEATRLAAAVKKEAVKGMRIVTRYEITGHRALLHWIAANQRDDITAFLEEWARKNHRNTQADGLRVYQTKEAY